MEKKPCKSGANDSEWDTIFEEIETSLHEDLPLRVRNWLKNKFSAPEIKNQHVNTGDTIQTISKK